MLMPNALRDKLDRDRPTVSTHFLFTDADIPEMIGDTGLFDYAEFVAEYSTFDMGLLYHLARAGQCGGNLPLMIKLDQEGQGFWAQAALGAGFKAVLFTDIRTPDDIDTCHRVIAPDTPNTGGAMGVKLRRPALTSYDTTAYLADLESIVFAIMIEKNVTVENIDPVMERARERGVDMTQWGTRRLQLLARQSGAPGHAGDPRLRGTRHRQVPRVRHPPAGRDRRRGAGAEVHRPRRARLLHRLGPLHRACRVRGTRRGDAQADGRALKPGRRFRDHPVRAMGGWRRIATQGQFTHPRT